ncbi:MAG: tetratricopeptide repeat protein [Planctomycetota bacterium]
MLSVLNALFSLALFFGPHQAEDQYQYIVGLSEKKMFEMAAAEADSFLKQYPRHEMANHARYRLAAALFEMDQFERAVPHFRMLQGVAGFEFGAESSFRLGQAELELGHFDAAAEAFRRTLALGKEYLKEPALFLLGEAAFRKGDSEAARDQYRAFLDQAPESSYAKDARYGLAWCEYRLKRYDEAIEAIDQFRRHHRGDPQEPELRFLKGECYLVTERYREALKAYEQVEGGPFRDAALRGSGFAHAQLKQHAAAAASFTQLLREVPESRFAREATLQGGIQYLKAGDPQAAIRILSLPGQAADAELLYWRSKARAEANDKEGALSDLDLALKKNPADELKERCQVARGDLLFDLGRTADATEAYGSSSSDYALHSAAVVSLNDGRHDDALQMATHFLKQYPESPYVGETHLVLGECLLVAKKYAEAARHFESAVAATGGKQLKGRALARLSWCRFLQDDLAGAAEGFAQVVKAGEPGDRPEALFMLGRSLESLGKGEEAAKAWKLFLKEYPQDPHRADVLLGLSRIEPGAEGAALLEELLEQHADHAGAPEALFGLSERLVREGERERAVKTYRRLLEQFPEHALATPARYGLAWCLYEGKQYDQATQQLGAFLASKGLDESQRSSALELLIWSEKESGRATAAAAAFDKLLQCCHEEERLVAAAKVVTEALAAAGRKADADAVWERLAKSGSSKALAATACIEQAYLQLDLGKLDEAERKLAAAGRLAGTGKELAEATFYLAEALFDAGEFGRAGPLYELAGGLEGWEMRDRALYKLGFTRMRAEDLQGAAGAFDTLTRSHRESPLYGESLLLQGEMLYRLGQFDAAIERLRLLRREVPDHDVTEKAIFRLGLAFCQTEQWPEGEKELTELVRRFPKFEQLAEAELWRGRALVARGNDRAARQAFDRVIALERGVLAARARLELGRMHYAAGEPEKALSEFLKVAVLYGTEAEVSESLFLAGVCLEKIGDHAHARSQYQELVQKYPRSPFAEKARERIEELKTF